MSILRGLISNKNISISNKVTIYKTCIRPIMTYACPVWCNTSKNNIKKLQVVQNKCLNIILNNYYYEGNDKYLSSTECHDKIGIEKIEDYIDKLAKNFYKYQAKNVPILVNRNNIVNEAWDKIQFPH